MNAKVVGIDIPVQVECPRCHGSGLLGGGTRSERDCERCEGGGRWMLHITLHELALDAIAQAVGYRLQPKNERL